jgi:5-methylthioadenosine/S-adenosylhomocysteine deaminase
MKTSSILIKNADWIITQNPKREVLKKSSIYIEGNRIVEIGKPRVEADFIIDGRNKVILPGLINTHTHLGMTVLRGCLDDMELHEWLKKCWTLESKFTKKDVYYSSLLGCSEMIKNGITCFHDMYYFGDEVLKAADESGMRGIFSQTIVDSSYIQEFKTPDQALKIATRLKRKWKGNERTMVNLGPHAIYTCSKETLIKTKQFAEENDFSIHVHLSETKKEVEDCLHKNGMRPVEYLKSIDFLSSNVLAVHCCWLNEKEIEILKENRVKVSHNPVSNMKTIAGIAPIPKMIDHGVCIGLGTDSAVSNNCLDLFQEMKVSTLIHKVNEYNPVVVPARKALEFATIEGAKALGLEKRIGSIEVGKKADIISIDLRRSNLQPVSGEETVISNLVYSAKGNDVCDVICDGKILVKDGELLTINEEKVYDEVNKTISNLLK